MKRQSLSSVRNFLVFWLALFIVVLAFILFIFVSSSATPILVASPLITLLIAGTWTVIYFQKYRELKALGKQEPSA